MDIILIDDETDSQFLFQQKFRKWIKQGLISLKYAASFKEGMDQVHSNESHESRIFLCDLNLPDGNGQDILKELRKKEPQSKIFILTGTLDKAQEQSCLDQGATAYFVKPIPFELLMPEIQKIMENK